MKYWLHPEAEADLREAAEHYRERAGSDLSQSLFAEFEHSVKLLLQHPGLGAMWRHGKRRHVMRRFPYSLIYAMVADEIRILAVADHSPPVTGAVAPRLVESQWTVSGNAYVEMTRI